MISACYAATYLGITSPDLRGSQHEVSLGSVSESNRPAITSLSEHSQLSQKALHVGSIGFPAAASNPSSCVRV